MSRRVGVLMTTTALAYGIAGFAFAGGSGFDVVHKNFKTPAGEQDTNSVKCPKGKVRIGGGFTLSQTSTSQDLNGTYPTRKGWALKSLNFEHKTVDGSVIGMCARDDDIAVRTDSKQGPDGSQLQATARCPKGSVAIGGGGKSSEVLIGSFPVGDPRKWSARPSGFNDETHIKAFAICDKSAHGVEIVQESITTPPSGSNEITPQTVKATCPAGKVLTGGGQFALEPATAYKASRPAGRSWKVTANMFPETTLNAFAVCVKP